MTPLIIDSRVILFLNILTPGRNILTPGHSVRVRVRVRGSIYFRESKYFVTPAAGTVYAVLFFVVLQQMPSAVYSVPKNTLGNTP